jgi:guanine deaminase
MSLRAYRASVLWFDPEAQGPAPENVKAHYEEDGLLVVGPNAKGVQVVQAIGSWRTLSPRYCRQPIEHLPGRLIAPGFVDMHVHFP